MDAHTQTQHTNTAVDKETENGWASGMDQKITMCARVGGRGVQKRRNDTCLHLACHTPKTVVVHLMIQGYAHPFNTKRRRRRRRSGDVATGWFGNKQEKVQVAAGRVGVFLFVNHKLGHTAVPARLQTTAKSLNGHPVIQD